MSNQIPKLYTYFTSWPTTDSLFVKMITLPFTTFPPAPWDRNIGFQMDAAYFSSHSGFKPAASIVRDTAQSNGHADSTMLAQMLWTLYGPQWTRLWNALSSEYNPLDNYSMKEEVNRGESDNRTIDRSGEFNRNDSDEYSDKEERDLSTELTHGHVVTTSDDTTVTTDASGSSALEHGENINTTQNVETYTYAFNSSDKVPTSEEDSNRDEVHSGTDTTTTKNDSTVTTDSTVTQTNSGKDITTESGSVVTTGTDTLSRKDTSSENTSDNTQIKENITRTRSGNTGQMSYQDLLRQEMELWKWNFFEQVFRDVDKYLCLSVFDVCDFPTVEL